MSNALALYLQLHQLLDEPGVEEIVLGPKVAKAFHFDAQDLQNLHAEATLNRLVLGDGPDIARIQPEEAQQIAEWIRQIPMSLDWTLKDRKEFLEHRILWVIRQLQLGKTRDQIFQSTPPWSRNSQ
ncbi:MAG: hypothetical protein C7B47_12685 [Sulfobacillus thermosulfidooxidans]|uniref:Uncharacterized protein n=1 Tax=Sulfobacillus thermosulfidooxidans TaxID=28034 RepID=A0A2T2WSQ4_SULTH|nr:MAG: hypothetical protein C7B47_12685 [Sulfobacillus thermosulfidooxidans]